MNVETLYISPKDSMFQEYIYKTVYSNLQYKLAGDAYDFFKISNIDI